MVALVILSIVCVASALARYSIRVEEKRWFARERAKLQVQAAVESPEPEDLSWLYSHDDIVLSLSPSIRRDFQSLPPITPIEEEGLPGPSDIIHSSRRAGRPVIQ